MSNEEDEPTTLAVSKGFARRLREHYNGHNDEERLQEWAKDIEQEAYNNSINLDDIDDVVHEAVRQELKENLSDNVLDLYVR